jgi:predicted nucleotidyltransferase
MDLITKNSPKKISACKEFGIKTLDVFGSAVSGKFNDTSDVDFIVVFSDSNPKGRFHRFIGLKLRLEEILARSVDLISYESIRNPYFKKEVDATKVNVYAA